MDSTVEPPKTESKTPGVVITVCMSCNVFLRSEKHNGPDMTSHGCCDGCAREFLLEAGFDPAVVP